VQGMQGSSAPVPNLEVQSFREQIIIPDGTPLTQVEIFCPAGSILWKDSGDASVTANSVVDTKGSPHRSPTDEFTGFLLQYQHNGQRNVDGVLTYSYDCLVAVP